MIPYYSRSDGNQHIYLLNGKYIEVPSLRYNHCADYPTIVLLKALKLNRAKAIANLYFRRGYYLPHYTSQMAEMAHWIEFNFPDYNYKKLYPCVLKYLKLLSNKK